MKGDCGECLVQKCYEKSLYTSLGIGARAKDNKNGMIPGLANGRGNGIDLVMAKGDIVTKKIKVVFIEVKAGGELNAGQQKGGEFYIKDMIEKMGVDGKGFNNARKEKGFEKLYKDLDKLYKEAIKNKTIEYRVCTVDIDEDKDPDDGCYGSDADGKMPGCGTGTGCDGSVSCYNWDLGTTADLKKTVPTKCD